jgi:hypothetical protein
MKILKILLFLIFSTLSASAQTLVQKNLIGSVTAQAAVATLPNPLSTAVGETCVAFAHFYGGSGIPAIADTTWTLGAVSADGTQAIWYAQPCTSQSVSMARTVTPPYVFGWIAEYTGLGVFDAGSPANGSSLTPSAVLNPATANEFVILGIAESGPTIPTLTPTVPLTVEWAGYNGVQISLLDGTIPAGIFQGGATYSGASYTPTWWENLIAFKPYNAPPPPPPINLNVTGSFLFDDGTPLAFGATVNVQQLDNTDNWVSAGSVTSDAAGNITGTFTVNPNFVSGGFATFQFSINGIGATIQQTFPLSVFQQGSTGVNLSLVIFKAAMVPKSFGAALVP